MPRPVRPWFRFYVEAFGDRKIRRLTPAQRWLWAAILGASRESCEPGALFMAPNLPMSLQELADYAGVPLRDVRSGLTAMALMSMVTVEDEVVRVTNWNVRQFESDDVTRRTRTHRERSEEQGRNVPRNAPETETETETETEKTPSAAADEDFDRFWAAYPRRVAKGAARRAWKTARKKTDADTLVAAAAAYAAAKARTDPQYVQHPASWLNAERWADEAEATTTASNGSSRSSWSPFVLPEPPPEIADDPRAYEAWIGEQNRLHREAVER